MTQVNGLAAQFFYVDFVIWDKHGLFGTTHT